MVDWKTVQLRAMNLDDLDLREFANLMFGSKSGSVVEVEAARKTAHRKPDQLDLSS